MPSDTDSSPRLHLPLLVSGQAQKELTHNEALLLIDMAVAPLVESVGMNVPPGAPLPGQCWITGAAPLAAWTGAANHLAVWTIGGWRMLDLPERAEVRERANGRGWTRTTTGWQAAPNWAAASGGAVIDIEARATLLALAQIVGERGLLTMA